MPDDMDGGFGAPDGDMNPMDDMGQQDGGEDFEDEKPDSEINDIFSKLDTEKQAAVIKYAKSMVSDDEVAGDGNNEPMPMPESRELIDKMVNEIVNNIMSDDDKKKDNERKTGEPVKNKKVTPSNPFVTKTFK